ncbi:uncharacterized protein LOC112568451 [Pomacea canaliculata]|uniref:uncharacterized protein LOC112568451 n=1 Tax=Pomacea canaliculata TaxID=400727 RepID=UPI000D728D43|nr:uncharacterized protein LOC112568451 [Pomacea canaliculata]
MKLIPLLIIFTLFPKVFASNSDTCCAQRLDDKINVTCTFDETNSDGSTARKTPLIEVTFINKKTVSVICPLNFQNYINGVGSCSCTRPSSSSAFRCTALLASNKKDVRKVVWKSVSGQEMDVSKLYQTCNTASLRDNNRSISNAPYGPAVVFLVIVAVLAVWC